MEHTTIDQAREALDHAYADCEADFGPDAVEAAAYDLIHSVADDSTREVRAELLRTELGVVDEEAENRAADLLFNPGRWPTPERVKETARQNRERAADRARSYQ
jgi:hypothetical protein